MSNSKYIDIQQRLKQNALKFTKNNSCITGTEHKSAFIFDDVSMNFNNKSFKNIQSNTKWFSRLQKPHSKLSGVLEMQSNNSSDALLMNIFCHPDFTKWEGPKKLLDISSYNDIEFGWNPHFVNESPFAPTEIDLKIGAHIFEAKLTEKDFTCKESNVVEDYEGFDLVFDKNVLSKTDCNKYKHYQLIRNILTSAKYNYFFTLFVDETRTDLIKYLFESIIAVKDSSLRKHISFITWQELADVCGYELKTYIYEKYLVTVNPGKSLSL